MSTRKQTGVPRVPGPSTRTRQDLTRLPHAVQPHHEVSLVGGVEVDVGEHRVTFEGDLVHGRGGSQLPRPRLHADYKRAAPESGQQALRTAGPKGGQQRISPPSQVVAAPYHLGEALSASLLLIFPKETSWELSPLPGLCTVLGWGQ